MTVLDCLGYLLLSIVLVWFLCLRRFGHGFKNFVKRKSGQYDDATYKMKSVMLPPIRGSLLKFFSKLQSSIVGHFLLGDFVCHSGLFDYFRTVDFEELPTFFPCIPVDAKTSDLKQCSHDDIEKLISETCEKDSFDFQFNSLYSYVTRYRSGDLTPSDVAERALRALGDLQQINAIKKFDPDRVKKMAADSTQRYKNKDTLSPIDGVLVVIKDEYHVEGLECNAGTSFLNRGTVSNKESSVVRKLRELGAVIFAVTNMHEMGFGTSGNNTNRNFGTCRNPHNPNHYPGGSSSGSAAAVAAGMGPMGLGSDGGGSIRIPSAYCGVVGLKATFGRITIGGIQSNAFTVVHGGPICTSVRDAAAFFGLLAGPDPSDPYSLGQPPVQLPRFEKDLTGLKIGIDRRYAEDCEPDVKEICRRAFGKLERSGAETSELEIPELFEAGVAHRIAIVCEMTASAVEHFNNHYEDMTLQSRVLFANAEHIKAIDYVQANRQRTRSIGILKRVFDEVDVIVTPTTAHCAPPIVESELKYGALNANQDLKNMRYAGLANLTGVPAVTVPVGYNALGLPCGLQIMSYWHREDIALQVAEYMERQTELRKPKVYVDLLES